MDAYRSLSHRKTALQDATALTDTIILSVLGVAQHGVITTGQITSLAHDILFNFDKAAASYFSARH
jgi:hypothetical protein